MLGKRNKRQKIAQEKFINEQLEILKNPDLNTQ